MKKSHLICTLMCLFVISVSAQNPLKPIAKKVLQLKNSNASFIETTLVTNDIKSIKGNFEIEREIAEGTLLTLDSEKINTLLETNPSNINLTIPLNQSENIEMHLYQSDILSDSFKITGSKSGTVSYASSGIHYHGIIKGDIESLVAISIFREEIHGFISSKFGTKIIGKLKGRNEGNINIIYNVNDLLLDKGDLCKGALPNPVPTNHHNTNQLNSTVGDCVKIYFEADHDIYLDKQSSTTNVSTFVTGFFNEVAVLYANESLEIALSELFIHESPSNYEGPSAGDYLDQFFEIRPSFNGDLGHYINLKNLGGIAYLGALCAGSQFRRGYSGIFNFYAAVPDYSWTINVIAHELGHNFGSDHTQACVWNGNNTAIDGCVDAEGNCANGPIPQDGTIMSYCHATGVGVDFTLGFGTQPGDVMRANVASANCLDANCTEIPPTCDDNIQNGNETGVDCGGTCPACPSCTDGILNNGETEIDCGGPICNACPSCNDGILNNGETGIDCGGPNCSACPSCNDGILNNGETAIDCGGPNCAACICNDLEIILTIVFDNFPEDITWQIKNASGTTIATKTYTNSEANGSTVNETICLPTGCYDFTILDSSGNGLCCTQGNGSYSLADHNGTVVASGATFTNSETTNFCLTSNCTPSYVLDGFDSTTKVYQATNYITSSATILQALGNASDITYEAGGYIDLTEGFYLLAGNIFLAQIVPCSSMPTGDSNSLLIEIDQNNNGLASFNFSVPVEDNILVEIFDTAENKLVTVIDNQKMPVGTQVINLDKRKFPSGLLMMKITSSTDTKMVKWIN